MAGAESHPVAPSEPPRSLGQPMQVLHLCSGHIWGGIESVLWTLAQARPTVTGLRHQFVCAFEGPLSAALRQSGAEVFTLGGPRRRYPWRIWRARRRLAELAVEHGDAGVIVHGPWAYALFGATLKNVARPPILALHAPPCDNSWDLRRCRDVPPGALLCNSRHTAGTAAKVFPLLPVHVLYWPVLDVSAARQQRQSLRRRAGVADHCCVILQAARLEARKGWEDHLAALARLPRDLDWQAWFFGGPQSPAEQRRFDTLRAAAAAAGIAERLRFWGQRDDVRHWMAAADIFCMPTRSPEPFGLVFVEALYAGLPVVTSDHGAAREIVTPECGRLVAPGDGAQLTQTLTQLIADAGLRTRLAAAAPARAGALCDPERQHAQLAAWLAELSQGVERR